MCKKNNIYFATQMKSPATHMWATGDYNCAKSLGRLFFWNQSLGKTALEDGLTSSRASCTL